MTNRQRQALDFISAFIEVQGYSPSYNEIMQELGFRSRSRVHDLVHSLVDQDLISIRPGCARSIRIVAPAEARMREALETAPPISHAGPVPSIEYVRWFEKIRKKALA